jgi:hypothetical protein
MSQRPGPYLLGVHPELFNDAHGGILRISQQAEEEVHGFDSHAHVPGSPARTQRIALG